MLCRRQHVAHEVRVDRTGNRGKSRLSPSLRDGETNSGEHIAFMAIMRNLCIPHSEKTQQYPLLECGENRTEYCNVVQEELSTCLLCCCLDTG